MRREDITIAGKEGTFGGYRAVPTSGTGPGIVVIQEIFGVNKVMRDLCDSYAAQGFVAVCPDLFWRLDPGIQLTDQSEEDWKRAFELFGQFDVDKGVEDIQATITYLREAREVTGKVGAVGYCLGGLLAYLTATRTDADAAVGYYGVNIQEKLEESAKIEKPLMLHIAGKDEFVPEEAQKKVMDALKDNEHVTIHHYPDCDHAFAREGGAHYAPNAAREANQRTMDMLGSALR